MVYCEFINEVIIQYLFINIRLQVTMIIFIIMVSYHRENMDDTEMGKDFLEKKISVKLHIQNVDAKFVEIP